MCAASKDESTDFRGRPAMKDIHVKRVLSASNGSYYAEILTSLFEFMMLEGSSRSQIERVSKDALRSVSSGQAYRKQNGPVGIALAAQVLDGWHRNRRYLDRDANPRAIPLLGKAPSVEALIRSERRTAGAAEDAKKLVSLGLVIKSGKYYLPASRVASIRTLHPFVVSYVARLLQRALSTVQFNVTSRSTSRRWLEGFAEVPDLPSRDVAAFRSFSREQGWVFLATINEWLETRRRETKRTTRGSAVSAGVQLFAWSDKECRRSSQR